MNRLILLLPYRIRQFLYGCLISRWRISGTDIPQFIGALPDINNVGEFKLGINCSFRSYRLKQRISVWSGASLALGDRCFLNDAVTICATQEVRIGNYAKIGDQVHIYDSDFHQVTADADVYQAPVIIGNNVWIGAKSMILAGSIIGDNSVIAAGSIVKGIIPANCVAAGSPAKVIKTFDTPENWIRK